MVVLLIRCPGSSREDTEFQPGHSLEAVDLRNPRLVRVASVASVEVRMLKFSIWMRPSLVDEILPSG
jgi:hypothetical protein